MIKTWKKGELNKLFAEVTAVRLDIEDAIATGSDKEGVFRHLVWHIPNGLKWKEHPVMSEKVKTLMQSLEEACGVTGKDIYEEDGKIDYREDLAMSKVEVETKPSEAHTEIPTDTPTSEPTETPTEAPTENPTETPDKSVEDETPDTEETV